MSHGFEPSKLVEEVSTKLPDTTKLLLTRRAAQLSQVPAEYLRDLVCLDIHGATYDELMLEHRRDVRALQAAMQSAPSAPAAAVSAVSAVTNRAAA